MTADRRLQTAAQAMIAAAARGESAITVIERRCPHICRQLRRDAGYRSLFALWGRSRNVDENVQQTIVHPAILEALGTLAGVPLRGNVVHAGLQHTYGYLFSVIDTPYGPKRERWLSTGLERGFGLETSLLSDRPRAGTLLANATWLAGQIAFAGQPRLLRRLDRIAALVAPALVAHALDGRRRCRIVEQATPRRGRTVTIHTDLLPFPLSTSPPADNTLLVYSVQNGASAWPRLITLFTMRPDAVRRLKASVPAGGRAAVRPRYNAHVPGWGDRSVPGRRFFAHLPAG